MYRTTLGFLTVLLTLSIVPLRSLHSQGVDKESLVRKSQRVMAIDSDGKPVVGVSIKPFGLNMSYFWPDSLLGEPVEMRTDQAGLATLEYPQIFADGVQCKSIDCVVVHPEYVGAIARIPVSEIDDYKLTLKKGVRFCLKAIDEEGEPIKERFAAMMSGDTPPIFRQVETNGSIETKSAAQGGHQVMLVQPRPDGKTRFSEALFFHFSDKDQEDGVVVDDVELLPGTRVFGRLPDDIARPVTNGVVMACQMPMEIKNAAELKLRSLMWSDWTTVADDGTFEFPSMPRSGRLQLIALCDGWVSPGERIMTKGQMFSVSEEDLEVALDMEPTMDAIIDVNDEFGNPIEEAYVGFWPNELWQDYGSQILGERSKSMEQAEAQIGTAKPAKLKNRFDLFSGKTNEKGRIQVRNLPSRSAQEFSVGKKGFEAFSKSINPPSKEEGFNAESTERPTSRIVVTLKKSDDAP